MRRIPQESNKETCDGCIFDINDKCTKPVGIRSCVEADLADAKKLTYYIFVKDSYEKSTTGE
jgi:hypothetical protein